MQHINSKNNTSYCCSRNKNDDWRKQSYLTTKKINDINNFPEFKFDGTVRLKPGQATVLLTLMLLGSVLTEDVKTVTSKTATKTSNLKNSANPAISNSIATSQEGICTASSKINDNVLSILTMAQLIDSKLKIDSAIPQKFHQNLHCEKIKDKLQQTIKTLPVTEEPIRRVMEHPEFELICTSRERITTISQASSATMTLFPSAFFRGDKKIYLINDDLHSLIISHEFIHADHFFRHTTAPYMAKEFTHALLPFYPPDKDNIKLYQAALNKGDKRINAFKILLKKINNKEKLSTAQLKRFDVYKDAAKDCLKEFVVNEGPSLDMYKQIAAVSKKPGVNHLLHTNILGFRVTVEILDTKKTPYGAVLALRYVDPSVAVCSITTILQERLKPYEKQSEELILAERDAYTFQQLSENAMKTFYPEAYEMRTRDLKKSETL